MIKPVVFRMVHFFPSHFEGQPASDQPYAAIVCYVHSDRMINVCAFTENGQPFGACSVQLLQDDDKPPTTGYYARWGDYQKGQAAKTESMEQQLQARIVALEQLVGSGRLIGGERQSIGPGDVGQLSKSITGG